jgi:hypothetical protein
LGHTKFLILPAAIAVSAVPLRAAEAPWGGEAAKAKFKRPAKVPYP